MSDNINQSFVNNKHNVCFNGEQKPINFMFMNKNKTDPVFLRITEVLSEKEIKLPKFQKIIHIESQHWNNWRLRGVPKARLFDISHALGLNATWLATGKGDKYDAIDGEVIRREIDDTPRIEANAEYLGGFDLWDSGTPLSDDEVALPFFKEVKLSAGGGSMEVQENHGCKLRFAKSTLKSRSVQPEHAYCVTVKGNSMEPVLPDGCTVGIDTSKREVVDGDWYAIDHLGELRVKLIYKQTGGGYRLRSFNIDEYPDEPVAAENIRILGRVFWWSGLR